MKNFMMALGLMTSTTAFATDLVNCAAVLRSKKIPTCTELTSPEKAGRAADVKKGQRWADEMQEADASDTYVLKGRKDICVDKFTDRAKRAGVCGG